MDKRDFLKASSAFLAGPFLAKLFGDEGKGPRTNWAGNLTYHTDQVYQPAALSDLQDCVRKAGNLRPLGTRHSFNSIADSTHAQISLKHFESMGLDEKSRTVTVGAGIPYGRLAPYLDGRGYALHNLASLPHISVVGACQTATHGSGIKNGNLSTAVAAIEFVDAEGKLVKLSRHDDGERFRGAVVGLGILGAISRITLEVQPTYSVKQVVYENLSFDQLEHNLEAIFSAGYSVSLFTDWQKHRATQVWVKSKVEKGGGPDMPQTLFGAKQASVKLHPLAGHSAENCTEQLGIPGPWYERLPHFRMNFTPSSGAELQTEYFVPFDQGLEAIYAVETLRDRITPHLFITELRTIAADDFWMSPCHQRRSLAIHFTWKPEWPEVKDILPSIEEKLSPFEARPHWAKLFTMEPARLRAQYPKLPDFLKLASQYDERGKFRNEFLERNLFST